MQLRHVASSLSRSNAGLWRALSLDHGVMSWVQKSPPHPKMSSRDISPAEWSMQIADLVELRRRADNRRMLNLKESENPLSNSKFTSAKGKCSAPLQIRLIYRSRIKSY